MSAIGRNTMGERFHGPDILGNWTQQNAGRVLSSQILNFLREGHIFLNLRNRHTLSLNIEK
jgi:hypothetical protein